MDGCRPRRTTRTFLSLSSIFLTIWIVVLGFAGPGCREQSTVEIDRNIAPETILTGAPGDSLTSFYRIPVYWAGFDTDGEVVGYEWAITDSLPDADDIIYNFTTKTDSIFRFEVLESSEVLGHRFYVRAIDDDGRRDPTPAFTFFAARNTCAPEVEFLVAEGVSPDGTERLEITSTNGRAPTDTIPTGWSVCFRWKGFDCDVALDPEGNEIVVGSIARYFYKLSPRELNDQGGSITDTSACYSADDLRSQAYSFFARAVDDAGFAGLDPELRSFVWNLDPVSRFTKAIREGEADSSFVFYADVVDGDLEEEDYVIYADGDTLPITGNGVRIWASVRGYDPDDVGGNGEVQEYQVRLVDDTGRWQTLGPDRTFRAGPLFTDRQGYKLMTRSRDALNRWGRPDTLRFYVNIAPRFVTRGGPSGDDFVQSPLPGGVIQVAPGDSTLIVDFGAEDEDRASSRLQRLEWRYKFDNYPAAAGGTGAETFFSGWVRGSNFGRFETISRDPIPLTLQSVGDFVPGDYTISMQVREARDSGDALGVRVSTRKVPFRVEYK